MKEKAAMSIAKSSGAIDSTNETIETGVEKKEKRIRAYRKEASRLASMANKRLIRLEDNKLTGTPSYQGWLAGGGERFGIRGKSYNEVQKEVAKMRKFLDASTSTVRGANRILKEIAKNTGIKYKNLTELKDYTKQFFEISSKVEQYLRNVHDIGSVYDSERIFKLVNQYVKEQRINLSNAENDVDSITEKIVKALDIYDEKERLNVNSGGVQVSGWYQLPKE